MDGVRRLNEVREGHSASLAVIGAGIAATALAASLHSGGWQGAITLLEAGRGPGGRAASRRSRHDPLLRLDHGAPLLNLTGEPPLLLESLRQGGWIEPWPDDAGLAHLDGQGHLRRGAGEESLLQGRLWRGRGGQDRIAAGLLAMAGPATQLRPGQLVQGLERSACGAWSLRDASGRELLRADRLVLSSTLLAHPRCRERLGLAIPPLLQAARGLNDPALDRALDQIAATGSSARCCLLLVVAPEAAAHWLRLPFRLLTIAAESQPAQGLERLTIQPLEDGRCAVVAQGNAQLAGGAPTEEAAQLSALSSALISLLDAVATSLGDLEPLAAQACSPAQLLPEDATRRLMRWGAAFPSGDGLAAEDSWCPLSGVGFCGDYLSGPGFGRIEGAWRSGEDLARRLLAQASDDTA